jgi:hypothetical protein
MVNNKEYLIYERIITDAEAAVFFNQQKQVMAPLQIATKNNLKKPEAAIDLTHIQR